MLDNSEVGKSERLSGLQAHAGGFRVGHVLTTYAQNPGLEVHEHTHTHRSQRHNLTL